jgi:hypothetical protein
MSTSLHKIHRRIWHDNYGEIPIDENGISYEIHHINGNYNDNRIENLKCVSIEEHYNIHYNQGDSYACAAILRRMKYNLLSFEERQKHLSLSGENHPMFGKNHSASAKEKISKNHADVSSKNNPMYGRSHTEESIKKISNAKKGHGAGIPKSPETRKKMSESVKKLTCPHCGKSARGNSMKRWHFDNCKLKG